MVSQAPFLILFTLNPLLFYGRSVTNASTTIAQSASLDLAETNELDVSVIIGINDCCLEASAAICCCQAIH